MLREEKNRLSTFIEVHSRLKRSAIILANDGFSYIRGNESHQEGIQCYFCYAFYPIDVENVAHNPNCGMINGNARDNIPYETDKQLFSIFIELYRNKNRVTESINAAADSRFYENSVNNINAPQSYSNVGATSFSFVSRFENVNTSLIKQPIACTDDVLYANSIILDQNHTSRQQYLQSREINVLGSVSTPVNPANAPATPIPEANQRSLTSIKQTQTTSSHHTKQEPAANRSAGRPPKHTPTNSELGIITERPKHSDYALKIKRLESFESWPKGHHITPNELADAGFYYAGYGDCARCFFCGGGMGNWEDEYNVWVEHARWFPDCAFIRQQIGQKFVDAVKDLNKTRRQITYEMVLNKMNTAMHAVKAATNRSSNSSSNQPSQQTVCKICMDKEVDVVFLPCGHLVSCGDCAVAMRDCPVCRVNVKGIARAFIA